VRFEPSGCLRADGNPVGIQSTYMTESKEMNVLYIGSEGRLEQTLKDTAARANTQIKIKSVENGKLAVIELMQRNKQIDYLIIDCSLKDIKCISIVDFILKDTITAAERIFVIAYKFSDKEISEFQERGVNYLTYTIDLKSLEDHFLKASPFP
jgi:CheY-like chemotaxis protein